MVNFVWAEYKIEGTKNVRSIFFGTFTSKKEQTGEDFIFEVSKR